MTTREEMRSLAEEIVDSYEDRISGIAEIKAAVSSQLKELDTAHAAMSRELKADLAKVRPALEKEDRKRQSEAREFMGELGRAVAQGKATMKAQLEELDATHAAMSTQLRADLAKGDEERLGEARALKQELVRGVAERKSAVSAQLRELADIQAGARDEWQKMTATMQAKRGGVAVEAKPPETVAALRAQVFEYLANHPDGVRMTELEQEFGIARIQMAKVVKSLIDKNKIEKRALLYFAV